MHKKLCNYFLLLSCLSVCNISCAMRTGSMQAQRDIFLQTEQLLDKHRDIDARANMQRLKNYPLLPYLEYKLLKQNLYRDTEVQTFLSKYQETRYAPLLRKHWLSDLIKRKQWRQFLRFYQDTNNTALQCQKQWALYNTGQRKQALQAATTLWLVGHSQPNACDALFGKMQQAGKLSKTMIWRRFDLALQKGHVGLAKYILRALNSKDQKTAKFWLKVHQNPSLVKPQNWQKKYTHQAEIFSHGIERMAREDPLAAITYWDIAKNNYTFSPQRKQQLETKLPLALAYSREPAAYSRLAMLPDGNAKVRKWRVRAALREQNWQHVTAALTRLSKAEQAQPKWLYWQARALAKIGKQQQAQLMFNKTAKERSFYGFLAAEHNHLNYHFGNQAIQLKPGSINALLATQDFSMINEFRILDRETEALRLWWHAVAKLDVEHIKIAAKLAERWQWHHIAVFTVAKAKSWDDLDLRFPVLFAKEVGENAQMRDLDPSLVFGLIRQESVFDRFARSPVGARGLMQIMPRTGKTIARDLRERWRSKSSLFNPDLNIKYGTYYYKQLLNRFNGHYALAAAAYNAGPHRVKHWLPEQDMLPTDIWIETIPFNETRKYVAKVLTYALIYQNQTGRNSLSMDNFMRNIYPQ